MWARSLGDHFLHAGLWNLEGFEPGSVEYVVFDDLAFGLNAGYFNYKDWLGGQMEFSCQEKYARKRRVKWGKPAIFICNVDPRLEVYPVGKQPDWEWMDGNVVFYEVKDFIFHANTE